MKRELAISLLCSLISSSAWCVCRVPQPRLACAEYFKSDAVVIAKLAGVTSVPKDDPDYFIYKLVVVSQLRGQIPRTFDVYEGNDSGRATFDWILNEKYLLFLDKGAGWSHYDWTIDGCGNSALLVKADPVLKKIQEISRGQKSGMISGMVGANSWTIGVPGATVKIFGSHYDSEIKTDGNGRFAQKVPIGIYKITAAKDDAPIQAEPFSYENPAHVVIAPGGCAQVQFTDSKRSSR